MAMLPGQITQAACMDELNWANCCIKPVLGAAHGRAASRTAKASCSGRPSPAEHASGQSTSGAACAMTAYANVARKPLQQFLYRIAGKQLVLRYSPDWHAEWTRKAEYQHTCWMYTILQGTLNARSWGAYMPADMPR